MTRADATRVVALLVAAFPFDAIEEETILLYADELAQLKDPEVAAETARRIARESERFPTLRAFREVYRAVLDGRREQTLALEEPTGPRDLPDDVRAYLAKLQDSSALPAEALASRIPSAEPGCCEDCGKDGPRVLYNGKRRLCGRCATSRLRAGFVLEREGRAVPVDETVFAARQAAADRTSG